MFGSARFGFPGGVKHAYPILAVALAACQSAGLATPPPRPLVNSAGTRLFPDQDRMEEVDVWVTDIAETIELDPSFLLVYRSVPEPVYPWETLKVGAVDSVDIGYQPTFSEIETPYHIYAFLHLMRRAERLTEWFPETEDLRDGWEIERFIVDRVADSWLLGRSTYDVTPYDVLDELIFAQDAQMLDDLLLYLRRDEFPDEVERLLAENPDGFADFERWYRTTFGREPPERGSGAT